MPLFRETYKNFHSHPCKITRDRRKELTQETRVWNLKGIMLKWRGSGCCTICEAPISSFKNIPLPDPLLGTHRRNGSNNLSQSAENTSYWGVLRGSLEIEGSQRQVHLGSIFVGEKAVGFKERPWLPWKEITIKYKEIKKVRRWKQQQETKKNKKNILKEEKHNSKQIPLWIIFIGAILVPHMFWKILGILSQYW